MSETITGGCQCGAVRFRAVSLGRPSICHCRMCQKQFGSFFGPVVSANGLVWTRGEPKRFQSSNVAQRGFCAECGTPLTIEEPGDPIEVAIGALDDPELAPPQLQVNPADQVSYFATLAQLPYRTGEAETKNREKLDGIVNYQHPDHDTESWPETAR